MSEWVSERSRQHTPSVLCGLPLSKMSFYTIIVYALYRYVCICKNAMIICFSVTAKSLIHSLTHSLTHSLNQSIKSIIHTIHQSQATTALTDKEILAKVLRIMHGHKLLELHSILSALPLNEELVPQSTDHLLRCRMRNFGLYRGILYPCYKLTF